MRGDNKFINFIKSPGVWVWAFWAALVLCAAAAALCAWFLGGTHPATCALYAVCLALLIYSICVSVRPARAAFSRMVASNKLLSHIAADYGYRTVALSIISLAINVAYAVYQGVLGIVFRSAWYGLFAGYYMVLSALRAVIIFLGTRKFAKKVSGGYKVYLACGGMFLILSVSLATLAGYLITSGSTVHSGEITVISMAAYAFYKIIAAAIHIVKNRKYGSFSLQALRNISFADAVVSIFALQISMVATFGGGEEMWLLNVVVGAAVVACTAGMGIYMMIRSACGLTKLRRAAKAVPYSDISQSCDPCAEGEHTEAKP